MPRGTDSLSAAAQYLHTGRPAFDRVPHAIPTCPRSTAAETRVHRPLPIRGNAGDNAKNRTQNHDYTTADRQRMPNRIASHVLRNKPRRCHQVVPPSKGCHPKSTWLVLFDHVGADHPSGVAGGIAAGLRPVRPDVPQRSQQRARAAELCRYDEPIAWRRSTSWISWWAATYLDAIGRTSLGEGRREPRKTIAVERGEQGADAAAAVPGAHQAVAEREAVRGHGPPAGALRAAGRH